MAYLYLAAILLSISPLFIALLHIGVGMVWRADFILGRVDSVRALVYGRLKRNSDSSPDIAPYDLMTGNSTSDCNLYSQLIEIFNHVKGFASSAKVEQLKEIYQPDQFWNEQVRFQAAKLLKKLKKQYSIKSRNNSKETERAKAKEEADKANSCFEKLNAFLSGRGPTDAKSESSAILLLNALHTSYDAMQPSSQPADQEAEDTFAKLSKLLPLLSVHLSPSDAKTRNLLTMKSWLQRVGIDYSRYWVPALFLCAINILGFMLAIDGLVTPTTQQSQTNTRSDQQTSSNSASQSKDPTSTTGAGTPSTPTAATTANPVTPAAPAPAAPQPQAGSPGTQKPPAANTNAAGVTTQSPQPASAPVSSRAASSPDLTQPAGQHTKTEQTAAGTTSLCCSDKAKVDNGISRLFDWTARLIYTLWSSALCLIHSVRQQIKSLGVSDNVYKSILFAFLGAFVFNIGITVRRLFVWDISGQMFWWSVYRTILSMGLAIVLSKTVNSIDPSYFFLIATASVSLLDSASRSLRSKLFQSEAVPKQTDLSLQLVQGIDFWKEQRLMEEGIESVQHLATCDFVLLALHTRSPLSTIVDWVDQAVLIQRFPGLIDKLKSSGLPLSAIEITWTWKKINDEARSAKSSQETGVLVDPNSPKPEDPIATFLSDLADDTNIKANIWKRALEAWTVDNQVRLLSLFWLIDLGDDKATSNPQPIDPENDPKQPNPDPNSPPFTPQTSVIVPPAISSPSTAANPDTSVDPNAAKQPAGEPPATPPPQIEQS